MKGVKLAAALWSSERESMRLSVANHTPIEAFAVVTLPEITSGVSPRDCCIKELKGRGEILSNNPIRRLLNMYKSFSELYESLSSSAGWVTNFNRERVHLAQIMYLKRIQ